MMNMRVMYAGLGLVLVSLSCGISGSSAYVYQPLGAAVTQFGFGLMQQINQRESPPNLAISPFSIATAFADIYPAARGVTREELDSVFGFGGPSIEPEVAVDASVLRSTASSAFLQSRWFLESSSAISSTLSSAVMSKIGLVSFSGDPEAARRDINYFFLLSSNRMVPEVLKNGSVNHWTNLLLANAVYFKGDWTIAFDQNNSGTGQFTELGGDNVPMTFMHLYDTNVNFKSLPALNAQAIELKYDDDIHSLLVIVPNSVSDFSLLQEHLNDPGAIRSFTEGYRRVHARKLSIPRIMVDTHMGDLHYFLARLHLPSLFDPFAVDLDLLEGNKVAVDGVTHRAILTINESGTGADTSNVLDFFSRLTTTEDIDVVVDKPFMFLVVNRDINTAVFMGYFTSPRG